MTSSPSLRPARRRNADATRAAILDAARARFTRDGYDGVGVRDIAADVGVNAALVIRYFGSKEALFGEALTQPFDITVVLTGERAQLAERLVRLVLAKDDVPGALDPVIALLRSATNESAATMLRDSIDAQFVTPLAAWLGGDHALIRAGLIAAALLGLAVTRSVIRSAALATTEVEQLVAFAAPTIQRYIDDPLAAERPSRMGIREGSCHEAPSSGASDPLSD